MSFDIRGTIKGIKYPCFAEIKYDGEYNEWHPQRGLVNKYGRVRNNTIITKQLKDIPFVLWGELCYEEGWDGKLYELAKYKNKDSPRLWYIVFDIAIQGSYRERREKLLSIVPDNLPNVHVATTRYILDSEELKKFFVIATSAGWEGIVVKNEDSFGPNTWVKMKKKQTADLEVYSVSDDEERIEVKVPHKIGGTPGYRIVGVKVGDPIRKNLKPGMIVEIEYQSILPSGSLRHPVFKRVREPGKEVNIDGYDPSI